MSADPVPSTNEEWRPIPGYEGSYEVSDQGRVRSLDRVITRPMSTRRPGYRKTIKGCILKPALGKGYFFVAMSDSKSVVKLHRVAHLVALVFIGPRPDGAVVCHNDGNCTNNVASNLRYASQLENARDKARHGTQPRGEDMALSKLTEADVAAIRSMRGTVSGYALAKKFGVSETTVARILKGKIWKHTLQREAAR